MNTKKLNKLFDCIENEIAIILDDHRERLLSYFDRYGKTDTFKDFNEYIECMFDLITTDKEKKKLEPLFKKVQESI